MLKDSFLSIVDKDCPRDSLLVRARRAKDIKTVFPSAEVRRTKGTDYRFRAIVKRKDVAETLCLEVSRITYDNFKDSVKDKKLHDAYLRVWSVMSDLQHGPKTWGLSK